MKKSISIVAAGFVGSAIVNYFNKLGNFNVYIYDLIPEKRNVECLEELVKKSNIIFICLPTPMFLDTGEQDSSIVESVLLKLDKVCEKQSLIIKSTILPNKLEEFDKKFKHLNLIYSPEFLTEANSNSDFENQDRIILGGRLLGSAVELFKEAFPNVPIYKTDLKTAAMVKYASNCFLMTKVLFFNEVWEVCQELGINYDEVKSMTSLDKRIGDSHMSVPGPDFRFAAAGSCFIKDLNAFKSMLKTLNVNQEICEAVWSKTLRMRPERDWELLENRAISRKK